MVYDCSDIFKLSPSERAWQETHLFTTRALLLVSFIDKRDQIAQVINLE